MCRLGNKGVDSLSRVRSPLGQRNRGLGVVTAKIRPPGSDCKTGLCYRNPRGFDFHLSVLERTLTTVKNEMV